MAPFKDIVPRPLKGNIISAGKFPLGMDKSKAVDLLSSHDNCIFREFEPDLTLSDIVTEVTATRFNGWKVEIIGYGPGAPSRKSKVKLRITSLGDTGA